MLSKFKDFLSSFGMMLAGVFLLFFSSVYFGSSQRVLFLQFPASGKRAAVGGDVYVNSLPISKPAVPLPKNNESFTGTLTAISAIVLDTKTKTVLFDKNSSEVRPLASITKL